MLSSIKVEIKFVEFIYLLQWFAISFSLLSGVFWKQNKLLAHGPSS